MARRQAVTRNCKSTVVTVNVYNNDTKNLEQIKVSIPRRNSNTKITLKTLQKYVTENYKILDIDHKEIVTEKRAMWLEDFLEQSFPYGK